jgi:hypothetical protein
MRVTQVVWDMDDDDMDDDVDGNAWHVSPIVDLEEVDEILYSMSSWDVSYTSGNPTVFSFTSTGRHIAVVFEWVDEWLGIVYPITAYDADF